MKIHPWLILSLALLVGCDQAAQQNGAGTAAGQSGAQQTGQDAAAAAQADTRPSLESGGAVVPSKAPDVLRYALTQLGTFSLDPAYSYDVGGGRFLENMYETLVGYQGSGTDLEGVLATDWALSEDGKSLRFNLRDGVKFHSGNPLTCADAEYTFRRNLVMNHPASSNWFLSQSLLGTPANANDNPDITWKAITAAVKCDGKTLVMTLPKYDPTFVPKLAYVGQAIVDSKHAKAIGEWDGTEKTWKQWVGKDTSEGALNQKPSGTGPFKLEKRTDNSMSFTAFDGYWGEKGNLKRVVFSAIPEVEDRVQALLNDEVDIVSDNLVKVSDVEGKSGIAIARNMPSSWTAGMGFNQNIKDQAALGSAKLDGAGIPADFFTDEDVRLGFSHAFDTDKFIQGRYGGLAVKRSFTIPSSFPNYDASIPLMTFDVDKATEHFKQAYGGRLWDTGFLVKQPFSNTADGGEAPLYLTMLRDQLQAINPKFKLELVPVEHADWQKGMMTGMHPLGMNAWVPDYADADNMVFPFFNTGGYYAAPNSISDKLANTMIAEARSAQILAERNNFYRRLAEYANSKAFYLWLPTPTANWKLRNSVQGFEPKNYNELHNYGVLWKNISKQ